MRRSYSLPIISVLAAVLVGDGRCVGSEPRLKLRIPAVGRPADTIVVHLELQNDRGKIAAVGSRLTYDAARVSLVQLKKGPDVPSSWSVVFQETAVPGQVRRRSHRPDRGRRNIRCETWRDGETRVFAQ